MELVGSGLEADGDGAAGGAPVLRIVVAGLDAELLGGIGARDECHIGCVGGLGAGIGHAIEQQVAGPQPPSVDGKGFGNVVAGIERSRRTAQGVGPYVELGARGGGGGDQERVAPDGWQIVDVLRGDHLALIGGHGLQQFGFGGHRDLFGERTHLQLEILLDMFADAQFHALANRLFESRYRSREPVRADRQHRQRIVAGIIGEGAAHLVGGQVGSFDRDLRHHTALHVPHNPADSGPELLCDCRQTPHQHQQTQSTT